MLAKKIVVLFLAMALSFALWGCPGDVSPGELSQQEVDQVVARAVAANAEFTTAKFSLDTLMSMEVIGGTDAGKMTATLSAAGAIDTVDQKMQMTMSMAADIPGEGQQAMTMEGYITGGWLYLGVEIPGEGKQWAKTRLTEEIWQQENQIRQQWELLKTAIHVSYAGIETVNGTRCYLFEIQPDTQVLFNLLAGEQEDLTGVDFSELVDNLGNLFKEVSIKMWVAKDNYLLMKADIHVLAEILPADFGVTATDFTRMTMGMDMEIDIYDYGQPVTVTPPPEALGALEM